MMAGGLPPRGVPVAKGQLARVGIPQPSFYLVRPDGHVGLCGKTADAAAIQRYLAVTIGLAVKTET